MKKISCIILALTICVSLCSCGKSKDVKAAEEAILAIGEVTIDSGDAIEHAEKLYNILTDSEKSEVSNRVVLVDAREAYDVILGQQVYENAKAAYDKLNEAAQLCIDGMDDIYGAWYFGIYEADDCTSRNLYNEFALKTPHFMSSQLKDAADLLGVSDYTVMSDWQYCLYVVEAAIVTKGTYVEVDNLLSDAQKIMQTLTDEYDDYEYYPKLKEYYAKVSSYAEFFKNPTGSFKQLADTINDYENGIRTYQTDVGFLF